MRMKLKGLLSILICFILLMALLPLTALAASTPDAPTITSVTAGYEEATVSFDPPASDGGEVITGYTVIAYLLDDGSVAGTATGTASPITVTDLTNNMIYYFTVKATNSIGESPESAQSNTVSPSDRFTDVDTGLHLAVYSDVDKTLYVTGIDNSTGAVTIPSTISHNGYDYTVTAINVSAFANKSDMTSVSIPDTVTKISYGAFSGCTGLTEVTIPSSVTSIYPGAFSFCTSLTDVTFEGNAPDIGDDVFLGDFRLAHINHIPDATGFDAGPWPDLLTYLSATVVHVSDNNELGDALGNLSDVVIILDGAGPYSYYGLKINGECVTIDTNGKTLNLIGNDDYGPALDVEGGGELLHTGSGSINVQGDYVSSYSNAVFVVDGGSSAQLSSITASEESAVVYAAEGGTVTVTGDIEAMGDNTYVIDAASGGIVTVTGNVEATGDNTCGILAVDGGTVTVSGNVSTSSDDNTSIAVYAADGGTVTVSGNVEARGDGVNGIIAVNGSTVTVSGNVSVRSDDNTDYAVFADSNGTVTVDGAVTGTYAVDIRTGIYTLDDFVNSATYTDGYFNLVSSRSALVSIKGYTLTLYSNYAEDDGMTDESHSIVAPAGSAVLLAPANVEFDSPPGRTFGTWNTNPDGSGAHYSGDLLSRSFTMPKLDMPLYAIWTAKMPVSITETPQTYTYNGSAKAFAISGTPATGFTITYNQGFGDVTPVDPGTYNVVITRPEDETYASYNYTITNGLVISPAIITIAAIHGITKPATGASPVATITETAQYTGSVMFDPADSPFKANTAYTATITLTPKTGYTLSGVPADFFTISKATASNAANSGVITAVFPATGAAHSGGGGSSSHGSSDDLPSPTPATAYNADVSMGNGMDTTLSVTVDIDTRTASIDVGSQIMTQNGTVITIPSIPDVEAYSVGIPVPDLSKSDGQGTVTVKTDSGNITVPSNMLAGVKGTDGDKAEIVIAKGDKSTLPAEIQKKIGDKPLISLTLKIDGKQTDWKNDKAPVKVSMPYKPTSEELVNPEGIVVWYVDGSGKAQCVSNGHYDPAAGSVTFETTHFSNYAVAYNPVSFNDVAANAWYNHAVSFIAAREITTGTGNGKFSPDAHLTRGDFLVMLMSAYGIVPDANPTDNFSDAGNTYYTGYLAAAKRLGITAGAGNNMYSPGREITRQEMFTLLYNVLKVIGQLPQGDSGKTLSDFTDAGQIDAWAKDAMTLLVETGTVGGSGGKLMPTGTTTRAEMAQVLYSLLEK